MSRVDGGVGGLGEEESDGTGSAATIRRGAPPAGPATAHRRGSGRLDDVHRTRRVWGSWRAAGANPTKAISAIVWFGK